MDNHPITDATDYDDDIDRFASRLLRNPDRAEMLKQDLRTRIGLARRKVAAPATPAVPDADLDDLWDNVPV